MRHAKSAWGQGDSDHDRPLAPRGRDAAPRMGRWLVAQNERPSVILASTAARAHATAELVVDAMDVRPELFTDEALYLPDPQDILDVLAMRGAGHASVLIVCHNPGVSDAILEFTGAYESMPTAAVAVIDFDIDAWSDLLVSTSGSLRALWRVKSLPER
ncbi:MAG: histidine phosphatase family protein [Phycisphaerales bacterium]|nr:histidine phosphatase family protein [Phycisphaerales bacterium]